MIVGETGESEQEVRDRVAAGGLEDRVTLLGPLTQDALFEEYRRASVFALPCRVLEDGDRDGIPNVLMEAMACRVPVVTTGVSGITELVRDGENGLIVGPDRPVDLADALHRLVKDPGLAHQLAERGRRHGRGAVRRGDDRRPDGVAADRRGRRAMSGLPSLRDGSAGPPATRIRPRQVFCPIEAQHRDLHVAQDAVVGRFHYAGVTLDLGHPPDWTHGGLADDEEWHIEWSKFYFGLELAHAFSVTDDRTYLDAWQGLVASWIDQREPDCDPPEVTARRVQNWLYAWQGFDRVPGFTGLDPQLEDRLLTSLAAQLEHVASNLTPERNHRTLELFALLVVSLGPPRPRPGGRPCVTSLGRPPGQPAHRRVE